RHIREGPRRERCSPSADRDRLWPCSALSADTPDDLEASSQHLQDAREVAPLSVVSSTVAAHVAPVEDAACAEAHRLVLDQGATCRRSGRDRWPAYLDGRPSVAGR